MWKPNKGFHMTALCKGSSLICFWKSVEPEESAEASVCPAGHPSFSSLNAHLDLFLDSALTLSHALCPANNLEQSLAEAAFITAWLCLQRGSECDWLPNILCK